MSIEHFCYKDRWACVWTVIDWFILAYLMHCGRFGILYLNTSCF